MFSGLIRFLLGVYALGLIVYCLASLFPNQAAGKVARSLAGIYNPLLTVVRRKVETFRPGGFGVDISPAIVVAGVIVLQKVLDMLF